VDRYTRIVLTVIALALVGLNLQLLRPDEAVAERSSLAPTYAELERALDIDERRGGSEAIDALKERVPVVWVVGGRMSVTEIQSPVEIEGVYR
jgi:hypothetical protein